MVYAYPASTAFSAKKVKKPKTMSEDAKALKDYYNSHDISIVKDSVTGKLVAKVKNK